MKKLFVYLLIILLFGAIFGIALSSSNVKEDSPVVGAVLDVFGIPATAYADDTGKGVPVPPPIIPSDP